MNKFWRCLNPVQQITKAPTQAPSTVNEADQQAPNCKVRHRHPRFRLRKKLGVGVVKRHKKHNAPTQKLTMETFLKALDLPRYKEYHAIFQELEFDMSALQHVTDKNMESLGFVMGPRWRILNALRYLRMSFEH
ncbi:hypothetical protein CTI12_AA235080 [Artemisia annua]|uniref:SAM domain-containing protein n=1 Tax=Artemisia annua TaxID=35608 RepID=A0A2U1M1T8_ARTAN|nr:hypothetical protein CTI12_AA235080 [Artemisia annua]